MGFFFYRQVLFYWALRECSKINQSKSFKIERVYSAIEQKTMIILRLYSFGFDKLQNKLSLE